MGIYNKIIINDEVILDLSSDTITSNNLFEGITAHDASGMQITGKIKKYNKEYTGNLEILEATMCSYNGTVLPKLPNWDKEQYPYAVLLMLNDRYYLHVSQNAYFVYPDNTTMLSGFSGTTYSLDENEWRVNNIIAIGFTPIWADYDLCYVDDDGNRTDTICLYATEPIPVYE